MRVALDATPLLGARTGVGRFVEGALGALAERAEVNLRAYGLTWRGRADLGSQLPAGVGICRTPMVAGPLLRTWGRFDGPAAEWWTGPVDVVHGTNFVVPPARRAAEVVTVHDLTAVRFPELCTPTSLTYPHLVRRAVRRGAWVHTPSAFVAQEVVELLGAPPDRVVAVPHGIGAPALERGSTPVPKEPVAGPPTILALGTVEPRKDLPRLVAAFDLMADGDPDARLLIAGPDGWGAEALHAAVAAARHADRVDRLGWVDERTRARLLAEAAVFAYPSRYEGFGLPPLEAMAAGVPVVATTAGALPEVLGDAALLVPPDDSEALAAALTAALGDAELRAGLRAAGLARAATYTWAATGDGLVDLYARATAGRPGPDR